MLKKKRDRKSLIVGLIACATLLAVGMTAYTSTQAATQQPREPKRLEEKITIVMGEMFFAAEDGTKIRPFKVTAGKTVGIHIVNKGVIEHEIVFGRGVMQKEGSQNSYHVSLFDDVPADVFVYPSGKKIEVETEGMIEEIELEPGADVWLRVKFPEGVRGTWEIGCFVQGHYEAGMKAVFIIE